MGGNGFTEKRKTYTLTHCLPYGDYLFTIYDTAGNGMCCDYGPGGFNVYANEILLEKGGVFMYSHTIPVKTFGAPTAPTTPTMAPHSDDDDAKPVKPTPAPHSDDDDAKPVKP